MCFYTLIIVVILQVQIENENILTMRGKRKLDEIVNDKEEDTKFVRMERSPVKLFRKFTLPSDANADAITANCVDGVLMVTVPKIPPPEPAKPKTVKIAVDWAPSSAIRIWQPRGHRWRD